MSQLKEWTASEIEEYDNARLELAEDGKIDCTRVYIKDDADKEIDFWKKESHDHYERWFNLNKQYEGWFGKVIRCERAERELLRQKYKRCLDKANYWLAVSYKCIDDKHRQNAEKHHYKWLEIARKFKMR